MGGSSQISKINTHLFDVFRRFYLFTVSVSLFPEQELVESVSNL